MVTPLFMEIFGGVILLTLLWVLPIYISTKREREKEKRLLDRRTYRKALRDFKENTKDGGAREAVIYFGHIHYSNKHPDEANYPFLELALNNPELPTPKEVRDKLISKDLKKIKLKKTA